MLELLNRLITMYGEYTKMNPVIAGAMSLYVLGTLTYLCRKLPESLWKFLNKEFTTTFSINSENRGYNQEHFMGLVKWFNDVKWSKYSRSLSMNIDYESKTGASMTVGVGNGHHFFFYKNHLFLMTRSTAPQQGMQEIVHHINLTMLGRNKKIVEDLVEEFRYRVPPNRSRVWKFNKEWLPTSDISERTLDTVIIDRDIKEELIRIIEEFKISEEWYTSRGLAYKKTFIFHGVPGTGKTSIVKALACHFKMNIALLNLNTISDEMLMQAVATIPRRSILAIEDFDSAKATKRRDAIVAKMQSPSIMEIELLTLTGILNALDGVVGMHNTLTFMTTNVLDDIDPAIYRKGRVDYIFEIKALRHKEVVEYIELMYPGCKIPDGLTFRDILGCDLQAIYFENRDDFMSFVSSIPWTADTLNHLEEIELS